MAGVGAALQLAAIGPQDAYMTTETPTAPGPSWQRYTAFATAVEDVYFPMEQSFGSTLVVTLPSSMADVLGPMFLKITLPALGSDITWVDTVGYAIIQRMQLVAGDCTVDDLDGMYHSLCDTIHLTSGQMSAVSRLVGGRGLTADRPHTLMVPLHCFFCKPGSCGLPLIAMTLSKLQLKLSLAPLSALVKGSGTYQPQPLSACLSVEGTLLTRDERVSLLGSAYDLYIERTLHQALVTYATTNNHDVMVKPTMTVDLSFMQGSVKQIIFAFLDDDGLLVPALGSALLFVNNIPQGDVRVGAYFSQPSAYSCCTACAAPPVYTVNFSLRPTAQQPAGVLDMTQVTSCFLQVRLAILAPLRLVVYSTCHAVLRFQNNQVALLS